MKSKLFLLGSSLTLVLAACVTINVYFPEAAAREAATEFISGVLSDPAAEVIDSSSTDNTQSGAASGGSAMLWPHAGMPAVALRERSAGPLLALMNLLVPVAHAQQNINIDINTPAIQTIQQRMRERQQNVLKAYYEAGAIGLDNDGLVQIRDRSAVGLSERTAMQQAVNADNQDRNAVYREIAVANGHPEWEDDIRSIFAERWIELAPAGWYYRDSSGNWRQK
ncbi:MAG: hypothetical protein Tsb0027_17150 [Wenzhouxiangellaceae bacterium]